MPTLQESIQAIEWGLAGLKQSAGTPDAPPAAAWPYPNDWSTPDGHGRVKLKYVETVLVPLYGDAVKIAVPEASATHKGPFTIPRFFFTPESMGANEEAKANVGAAELHKNEGKACVVLTLPPAHFWSLPTLQYQWGDKYADTLATLWPLAKFCAQLEKRARLNRCGIKGGWYDLQTDDLIDAAQVEKERGISPP